MTGYTKLFGNLITSTIWQEPNDCRVLWITMLALKGEDNICNATVPSLAKLANISVEDCENYLTKFQQPDRYSRTTDFDGRRIEKVDGGWLILNGQKYRDMSRGQDRREYIRKKVAEHRARVNKCKQGNQSKPIADTDTEAYKDPPSPPTKSAGGHSPAETRTEDHQVEPPNGFPKTSEEAKQASITVGCPPEFAEKVWDKAMSRAGRDSRDIPIRRWQPYLATEWRYEQERLAKTPSTQLSRQDAARKATLAHLDKLIREA